VATGEGLSASLAETDTRIRPEREFVQVAFPHERPDHIAKLHDVGQVVERRFYAKTARFKVRIPPHCHSEFAPFIVGDGREK
jgi:hypothetical protein